MFRVFRIGVIVLCAAALVGCGDDTDDGGDARAATTVADPGDGSVGTTTAGAPGEGDSSDAPVTFESQLSEGDCFDDRFDDSDELDYSQPPLTVGCAEPHDNEVVAIYDLGVEVDGAGPGSSYPEEETWDGWFSDLCVPSFDDFLGVDDAPRALRGYSLEPQVEEWDAGARTMACVLFMPDAKLAGSLSGVGHDVVPASFPPDAPLPETVELSGAGNFEDSYSPSDNFVEDAGIDTDGYFGATFEGGDVHEVKEELEATFVSSDWEVVLEDQWRGDVATAFYALENDGRDLIVEIWELEGGDSRLHFFYLPE